MSGNNNPAFLPQHTSEALANLNKTLVDTLHPKKDEEGRLIPEVTRMWIGEGTVFSLADGEENFWQQLAEGKSIEDAAKEDMIFDPAKNANKMTTAIMKYRIAESEAPFARNARQEWMKANQVAAIRMDEEGGEVRHPFLSKIPVVGRRWK